MIFEIVLATAVVFLMLRTSGSLKSHLLAFVSTAIVTGVAAFVVVEVARPYPGYSSGVTIAGFLASFEAVNDAFPPKHSRSAARDDPPPTPLTDRPQMADRGDIAERSGKERANDEPHGFATCRTMDGKAFAWFWPNVPFAATTCSHQRGLVRN